MTQKFLRTRTTWIWIAALMTALGFTLDAAAAPGEILQSFPAPGSGARDLSWDGTQLWLLDDVASKIYRIDTDSGAITREIAIDAIDARGIAWQAGSIWLSDAESGLAIKIDSDTRSILSQITTPVLTGNTDNKPSALAWRGDHLWCGTIAGWSSRVNQLDPESGEVIRWFFSKGFPEGIATDSSTIWTVTHNAGERVGLVYRYNYEDGIYISQFDTPGRRPVGLAFDGEALWCADRETQTIYRLAIN